MNSSIDDVRRFSLKVWKYREGQLVALSVYLGDRLGLYRHLAGKGPQSAADLAGSTGFSERWLLEWLRGQAAADLLESSDGQQFELTDVGSAVLAEEEESMFFAAGGFPPPLPERAVAAIVNGFQTGAGFGLDMLGPGEVAAGERMSSPVFRALLPSVIAGVDRLEERLAGGARVAEIGCGSGVLLALLGRRYPDSSFEGYDVSQLAVARARQATGELSNVIVHEAGAEELASGFDVIIAFDCIHDMPHPDRALAAARRAIADDGIFLIKDIKSAADFAGNRKNPLLAMMYGFSLTSCLPSALSDRDGMGLGTLGFHPEKAREMLTEAGFSSFEVKDFDDPVNLYYVARP